jgi:hypothetical protein
VLEWSNPMPLVKKHYGSGNMQKTQETATAEGVVWLTIVSSHEGKQGYVTPDEAKALTAERARSRPTSSSTPTGDRQVLRGEDDAAHVSSSMRRQAVYAGAIDDTPTADVDDLSTAKNWSSPRRRLKAGRPVATPESEPYGCSVKY